MLKIGEFSKLSRVSIRMLRHYDDIVLLKPAEIDNFTGYCYYREEQDAYILGVDQPVERFIGKIIAIIHRYDDVEEKWVVCPEDASYTKEEIMELIRFQEQYYQLEIIM